MESKRFFDLDKCKGSRLPFPFWSSSPRAEILYKCSAKGASRVHKFQNGEACPHAVQEPSLDTLATEEDLICLRFGMMNFEIRGFSGIKSLCCPVSLQVCQCEGEEGCLVKGWKGVPGKLCLVTWRGSRALLVTCQEPRRKYPFSVPVMALAARTRYIPGNR